MTSAGQPHGISAALVSPETVIMKTGGWRTRSVFERYAIVSRGDIVDAMRKFEINQQESQIGH